MVGIGESLGENPPTELFPAEENPIIIADHPGPASMCSLDFS